MLYSAPSSKLASRPDGSARRGRRKEGIPLLIEKFERNVARVFAEKQRRAVLDVCLDRRRLAALPVNEFFDLMVV